MTATNSPIHLQALSPALVASLRPRGPAAEAIAGLWWVMLAMGGFIFVVFAALLVRALFRRGSSEEAGEDLAGQQPPTTGHRWILVGGVALPTIVLIALMWLTLAALKAVSPIPPADAVTIEVVGHQWWWEVKYPNQGVTTANEIHIPVGIPVEFTLRSDDVIHSFWIPALHGKLDALPDYTTTLIIQADEAGQYRGACAEFCGLQHTKMGLLVVATPREQFEAWVVGQQQPAPTPSGAARQGLEVFLSSECVECHTIRGTGADAGIGPDLTHLADRLTIGAGTLLNEPEQLAAWVRDPHASKEGVEMPAAELSDDELEDLLVYLASLR